MSKNNSQDQGEGMLSIYDLTDRPQPEDQNVYCPDCDCVNCFYDPEEEEDTSWGITVIYGLKLGVMMAIAALTAIVLVEGAIWVWNWLNL